MTSSDTRPAMAPGTFWFSSIVGLGIAGTATAVLTDSTRFTFIFQLTTTLGSLAMVGTGIRSYRPAHPRPWCLLIVSTTLFISATTIWQFRPSGNTLLFEMLSLIGYAVLVGAAIGWIRPRRTGSAFDLWLDSALVGFSALLAGWTFLVGPALHAEARTESVAVIVGYPAIHAVLLVVLVHSMFTTSRDEIALRLLHAALTVVLLNGLVENLHSAGLFTISPEVMLVAQLPAYLLGGLAAMHPSMAVLGSPRVLPPHRSRRRAFTIAFCLVVASLIPATGWQSGPVDRIVTCTLFTLLLVGMLVRSERAIARSERSERRARYRADHDMLTGLFNRAALLRALVDHRHTWSPGPVSLLFIDLDGFKVVNDSYGHAIGDELIADAADRIRRTAQRDDVVARYGGDEFVLLTPAPEPEAAALAQRLLGAFMRPFELTCGEIPITASIGIATSTGTPSIYDLLQKSDTAMYHAKKRSLGFACHSDLHRSDAEVVQQGLCGL